MEPISLSKRQREIVMHLNSKAGYQTSEDLGLLVNVSGRTVRNDIKTIREVLREHGADITMKKGYGFKFVVTDQSKFSDLYLKEITKTDDKSIADQTNYEYILLDSLFMKNESPSFKEICTSLHISTSAVNQIIRKIRSRLLNFNLKLINKDGRYVIHGDEIEKRRFILSYFMRDDPYEELGFSSAKFTDDLPLPFEQLYIIVIEESRQHNLHFSDFTLKNIVIHLALLVLRVREGHKISIEASLADVQGSTEHLISKNILDRIGKLLDMYIPPSEYTYLTLHLMAKASIINSYDHGKDLVTRSAKDQYKHEVIHSLIGIQKDLAIDFLIDDILLQGIMNHLNLLKTRLEMNLRLPNPLLGEIESNAPGALTLTKKHFSNLEILTPYEISDEEWAYLTFHVLAAAERYKQQKVIKVIVICASGLGSARMLKEQLENRFGTYINIIDIISYYQLNSEVLKGIDLIISTIDISNHFMGVPVIKIGVFVSFDEYNEIDSFISSHLSSYHKNNEVNIVKESTPVKEDHLIEIFNQYFNSSKFVLLNEKISRNEAIEKLSTHVQTLESKKRQSKFINQVELREKITSTAFSKYVACPHPVSPQGVFGEVIVGVSASPIEWDEKNKSIQIVFLISQGKYENENLHVVMNLLSSFIQNYEKQQLLLKKPTFKNFRDILLL